MTRRPYATVSAGFDQDRPEHGTRELFHEWVCAQRTADELMKAGASEEHSKAVLAQIAAIEHQITIEAGTDPEALAASLYFLCHREYGPLYGPDAAGLDPGAGSDQFVVSSIRAAAYWIPEIADLASSIMPDRGSAAGL